MSARKTIALLWLILFTGCAGNDAEWREISEGPHVLRSSDSPPAINSGISIDTAFTKPSENPDIPANIATWLEDNGYWLIPITGIWNEDFPNVIYGEFITQGEEDIAVLVSNKTKRSLIVFPNKSLLDKMVLLEEPDAWDLDERNNKAFSITAIHPVGKDFIMDHYEYFGGPAPPEITHLAINYAVLGSTSVVFYFNQGEWLQLQGAD